MTDSLVGSAVFSYDLSPVTRLCSDSEEEHAESLLLTDYKALAANMWPN